MSAIGNCPWCGDPDPIVRTAGIIAVYCTNLDCVAHGPIASTPDRAIIAWNRLATPGQGEVPTDLAPLTELLAAAEGVLDHTYNGAFDRLRAAVARVRGE